MIELDRPTRDAALTTRAYTRLLALGSVLNAKIQGGPVYTLIASFVAMISDAYEEVITLLAGYNPMTATGASQDQVLGFFELPRLQPTRAQQTFTILRTDATAALVVPVDAAIQTALRESGKTYSYKVLVPDATTIPIGTYFQAVVFEATEAGLVTSLSVAQVMQVVSGISGVQVVAGLYDGSSSNPLSTLGSGTMDAWLAANASHFTLPFRVQGRDLESDDAFRARCLARWDEQAVGATAASYEAWAADYVDPLTGNSPVSIARVSDNQVFSASTNVAPAIQPLVNGQQYVMGVEVAVAFRSGAAPATADLQGIADYIVTKIPHTDKVWLRGPNMVTAGAGAVAIQLRGSASIQTLAAQVATSFFIYDGAYPQNYQGLGSTIYQSEIIRALMDLSPSIEDVRVVFTLSGKVDIAGDIVLLAFDQIAMPTPSTSVVVTVV